MLVREALIQQGPSLALQRAASDEIARLDQELAALRAELRHEKLKVASLVQKLDNQRKE